MGTLSGHAARSVRTGKEMPMPIRPPGRRMFTTLLAALVVAVGTSAAAALTPQRAAEAAPNAPAAPADVTGSLNMQIVAHNDLGGGDFGKGGEGFSELATPDGHRILYVANESGPICF